MATGLCLFKPGFMDVITLITNLLRTKEDLMEDLMKKIDKFESIYLQHIDRIDALSKEREYNTYKKLIFLAIIDGLSKSVFSREGNRKKFILFLKKFSDWHNGELFSLPKLVKLIKKGTEDTDDLFENIRSYASEN